MTCPRPCPIPILEPTAARIEVAIVSDAGWLFAVLVAAAVAVCAARLVVAVGGSGDWRPEVPHLAMGVAMVSMLAPHVPPLPRGCAVPLLAIGAWYVWCLTRPSRRGARTVRHLHGVTGCAAMAYMLAVPAMAVPGMTGAAGPAITAVNAVLAAYFLLEAAWSAVTMAARPGVAGDAALLTAPHVGLACHMATALAMSYMLLTSG